MEIRENIKLDKKEFYEAVASIFSVDFKYREIKRYKRWTERVPGNCCFPGTGLVRWFSSDCIHVLISNENKIFKSLEEALEYLRCQF